MAAHWQTIATPPAPGRRGLAPSMAGARRTLLVLVALGALVAAWAGPASGGPRSEVLRLQGRGGGPDYAVDVAVSARGGRAFITGSAYGGIDRNDDYVTVAYEPSGSKAWVAAYDGPDSNIDQAAGVAVAPDGDSVFVAGYSFGGPSTTNDFATVAYDAVSGERLWVARYDGPGHDTDAATDVGVAPDGARVFVTGASVGSDGSLDVATVAYDAASGQELWVARSGGPGQGADEGLALAIDPAGNRVYVTGYVTAATLDVATFAYRVSDGSEAWARILDAGADELARSVAVAPDGSGVFVAGARQLAPSGGVGGHPVGEPAGGSCLTEASPDRIGWDYVTAAYEAESGSRQWKATFDGPARDCDEAYDVASAPDGDTVFVTGSSLGVGTQLDMATVAYDADAGGLLWVSRYDGPAHSSDLGNDVVTGPDGQHVFVTGPSAGGGGEFDYLSLILDAATGTGVWADRYDGPGGGFDAPNALAIDPAGTRLYVTGGSAGPSGVPDYATVVYLLAHA